MNIHEHQAKDLLREFGAPVSKGVVVFSLDEIDKKITELNSKQFLKAQIHAGGRGKGKSKIGKNIVELKSEAKKLFGKTLITHQTGSLGKEVKSFILRKRQKFQRNSIFLV